MYIRSFDGLGRREPLVTYDAPGLSDGSGKEIELASELIDQLTGLVFFARHPELKERKVKTGAQKLEWNKIRSQLIKPSSASSPSGFVIDLTTPQTDPKPDYSKTEEQLGVWERAKFSFDLRFELGAEKTILAGNKPGSYVSSLTVKFDRPQFTVFIANHLWANSRDMSMAGADRNNWNRTRLLIQEHAYIHLKIFRRATGNLEKALRELFNRLLPLPTAKKPLPVSKEQLDDYLNRLGEFLTAIIIRECWEKTCDWEKKDYPELSRKINRVGAVFMPDGLKVDCGSTPSLPEIPLPPVPIKAK
jgi:hypothetical protein